MKDILVVKYGSGLTAQEMGVDQGRIDGYAEQLASLEDRFNLIVVTSGAVAAGRSIWGSRGRPDSEGEAPSLQTYASLGSPRIFEAWQNAFERTGKLAGAIPITHREIDDASEGPVFQRSLRENMESGVATIVNENDAVSDTELALLSYGGENDGLASHVARSVGASALILLTNRGGLYDDIKKEIKVINEVDYEEILQMMLRRITNPEGKGRGGPYAKAKAAIDAARGGVDAHVASVNEPITAILEARAGTYVPRIAKVA
ncbi:MAG TPA: hypothetical protein VLE74_03505 [Candidatus Saccharimonadales bacterium]|nr:hypothetical protein [Candidatus Saccharimonadales bacterium]